MSDTGKRDWITIGSLAIVGASAAITSFSAQADLAKQAGWPGWMPWLLPATDDVYGVAATRIWLSEGSGPEVKKHARAHAFAALLLSMAGNAMDHALKSHALKMGPYLWLLVVAVSLVPPIALGALMHLVTLRGRDETAPEAATVPTVPVPNRAAVGRTVPPARPAQVGSVEPNRAISAPRPSQATAPTVPATKPSIEPTADGSVPADRANRTTDTESDSAPVEKKPGGRPAKAAKARAVEIYREHHKRGVILNDRSLMKLVNDEFGEEVIGRTACATVIRKQREAMRTERTG